MKRQWPEGKRRSEAGVSILEAMIAILIFSVALLGSFSLVTSEWGVVRKTQEQNYVNRILESRLEEIRDITFDTLESMPSVIEFEVLPATTVRGDTINPNIEDSEYQRELQDAVGTVYLSSVAPDVMEVLVTVTWQTSGQTAPMTMQTATLVARNGVGRQ